MRDVGVSRVTIGARILQCAQITEMPANLSPEYKRAEQAFRMAREPRERLDCLKEMLRTIQRHKGTEHLQAHIKSRIRDADR
jgi:hypothetical protein